MMLKNVKKEGERGRMLVGILLLLALGIILLLTGGAFGEKSETEGEETAFCYENLDPSDYARQLEIQIAALCSRVDGAGEIHAVVTLAGGYRAVFASDSHASASGNRTEIVLAGNGSSETAMLLGYENPEIAGIGIVCPGGNDPAVQSELLSLLSATYHISTARIYIVAGNGRE
ncbi:MAG: hypothetical protein IJY42_03950 [Clostridia bacterium]|nr:hypothetical protein [Clostridia bacterium]